MSAYMIVVGSRMPINKLFAFAQDGTKVTRKATDTDIGKATSNAKIFLENQKKHVLEAEVVVSVDAARACKRKRQVKGSALVAATSLGSA